MIQHQKVWLPDGEGHLQGWMTKAGELDENGRGTYQIKKLRAATEHCAKRRLAVDVGAHVGLWTMQLAKLFEVVVAFEPVAAHRKCFERNMKESGTQNARLFGFALGASATKVKMVSAPTSSGDTSVSTALGTGDTPMVTLDEVGLLGVDFLKIDCEGFEWFVLQGAAHTIAESRPVVIVEQKPGHAQKYGLAETQAVEWLKLRGYDMVKEMAGDFIMVPKHPDRAFNGPARVACSHCGEEIGSYESRRYGPTGAVHVFNPVCCNDENAHLFPNYYTDG